jgi:chromatin structure-remodeling complex subunit RSC1/2
MPTPPFFSLDVRGRPKYWDPSLPTYVCEHRYKEEGKSFKKIKKCVALLCRLSVIFLIFCVGFAAGGNSPRTSKGAFENLTLITRSSCIPEEVRKREPEYDEYPQTLVLPKLRSPFVRGVQGPGKIGAPLEKEEDGTSARYFCTASSHA